MCVCMCVCVCVRQLYIAIAYEQALLRIACRHVLLVLEQQSRAE
jgi:hypothetical protein